MINLKIIIVLLVILFNTILTNALILNVSSPISGSIYNFRNISYNMSSDDVSDFYIIENRVKSIRANKMCDNVLLCNVIKRAKKGITIYQ